MVGVCGDRRRVMPPPVPHATYRVQFTKDFTFDDAAAIAYTAAVSGYTDGGQGDVAARQADDAARLGHTALR